MLDRWEYVVESEKKIGPAIFKWNAADPQDKYKWACFELNVVVLASLMGHHSVALSN